VSPATGLSENRNSLDVEDRIYMEVYLNVLLFRDCRNLLYTRKPHLRENVLK